MTTDANEMVAEIHDRMPLILAPQDYTRWLSDEPDPRDLMRPYPSGPMRMWPISTGPLPNPSGPFWGQWAQCRIR
ncbi:MAG TPA: SOS response-associated peptidase family protein [Methylocella sp.]|nr:SOS response-associated peptidase family protein [Methylocella sp.]